MRASIPLYLIATCASLASAVPMRDRWTTAIKRDLSRAASLVLLMNTTSSSTSGSEYLARAQQSIEELQSAYYNESTGLYNNLWWNSANALTSLADFAALSPGYQSQAAITYGVTFARAQEFNHKQALSPNTTSGFINNFWDDEGWWAWAWLKAYDQTHHPPYLSAAINIFQDQTKGYHASCGGLLWSKTSPYNGAIANELFLYIAAALANRVPAAQKQPYLDWALREWDWFRHSGLINAQNLINDGLDNTTCKNNNATVYTYNQGVILAGLVELHNATVDTPHAPPPPTSTSPPNLQDPTANPPFLDAAVVLAQASIGSNLTSSSHILQEKCDPECTGDAQQFKGPYIRGLQMLQRVAPRAEFKDIILRNADAVWATRGKDGTLSSYWGGDKWDGVATVQAQSAGLDALIAAAAVGGMND